MKDRVQKVASLHEKTVQGVANGTVGPVAKKPRKRPQNRSQPLDYHIQADRRVMDKARRILMAKGEEWAEICPGSHSPVSTYTKIVPINATTVIVR